MKSGRFKGVSFSRVGDIHKVEVLRNVEVVHAIDTLQRLESSYALKHISSAIRVCEIFDFCILQFLHRCGGWVWIEYFEKSVLPWGCSLLFSQVKNSALMWPATGEHIDKIGKRFLSNDD